MECPRATKPLFYDGHKKACTKNKGVIMKNHEESRKNAFT